MTVQERITRELCEQDLWRDGAQIKNPRGESARALVGEDVSSVYWRGDSPFGVVFNGTWLLDLDDTATHGVLWNVLCEACDGVAATHRSPAMDRDFVVVMKTHQPGDGYAGGDVDVVTFPIAENGLGFALASAILAVWGVEVW